MLIGFIEICLNTLEHHNSGVQLMLRIKMEITLGITDGMNQWYLVVQLRQVHSVTLTQCMKLVTIKNLLISLFKKDSTL